MDFDGTNIQEIDASSGAMIQEINVSSDAKIYEIDVSSGAKVREAKGHNQTVAAGNQKLCRKSKSAVANQHVLSQIKMFDGSNWSVSFLWGLSSSVFLKGRSLPRSSASIALKWP